ncbi:MAG: type II toxin-antitoxin system HicB family antitoxin [Acidobacteria bacterium]|nr:type II toxin-antitoxin system HicB family antitoxin [Acidobacteriota bacterium]
MIRAAGAIWIVKFTVAVTHDAPSFVAGCWDVEIVNQGETVDEALANLAEALGLCFEGDGLLDSLDPLMMTALSIPA